MTIWPVQALDPTDFHQKVFFFGKALKDELGDELIEASIDMSLSQVTQISLTFHDPKFARLKKGYFRLLQSCVYEDYKLQVSNVQTIDTNGQEAVTVMCRPQVVRKLKDRRGKKVMKNASPSDFVKEECKAVNAGFIIQKSAKRKAVMRDVKGSGDGSGDTQKGNEPSSWTTFQRLAQEVGFVCFEVANTIYFGKPTWIMKQTENNPTWVHWGFKEGTIRPTKVPSCQKSIDSKVTTISVELPTEYAIKARIGKAMKLTGVPGFEGTYLISQVSYPLMNATTISVKATTPENPEASGWKRNPASGSGLMDNEDTTTSDGGPAATGTKSASAFVRMALGRVGATYVYGAEASADNPNAAAFDCSELVEWAASRVGVFIPDGSQAQRGYCISKGQGISIDAAIRTAGALLFTDGHVAISLGNGSTVEAVGTGYGVRVMSATERSFRWVAAGRIPGMRY